MRALLWAVALIWVGAGAAPASGPPIVTIGLLPDASPEVTRALADGLRLALRQGAERDDVAIEVVVGGAATHWSTASAPAVELALSGSVAALLTPPDRATAHLLAQIGSRAHIPVLTTTRAESIGSTGSYWVIPLLEPVAGSAGAGNQAPEEALAKLERGFADSFQAHFGYQPDGWAAIGYRAGRALLQVYRDHPSDRLRRVRALKCLLSAAPCPRFE